MHTLDTKLIKSERMTKYDVTLLPGTYYKHAAAGNFHSGRTGPKAPEQDSAKNEKNQYTLFHRWPSNTTPKSDSSLNNGIRE
jgi:hypothetical protein